MNKKKRNTILLAAVILLISGVSILLQNTLLKREGAFAVVQVDGQEITRLDLSENTAMDVGYRDGYNVVKVLDGYVFVSDANCPDKICVNTGKVKNVGDVIACLPHKTIITVTGADEDDIDGITW